MPNKRSAIVDAQNGISSPENVHLPICHIIEFYYAMRTLSAKKKAARLVVAMELSDLPLLELS